MSRLVGIGIAVVLALAVAACGDDDSGNASPSPTAPPSTATAPTGGVSPTAPSGAACPVAADVCAFAATVRAAVGRGDAATLVATAQTREFTCPATRPQGLGGPYPLCDGAAGGTRQGFRVAFLASEGQVVTIDGLRAILERWLQAAMAQASDQYGSGANRLYTVACPAGIVPCGNQFVLVFSQLFSTTPGTPRTQLMLYYERSQAAAQPRLTFVALGPLLQPGEEQAALRGGAFSGLIVPEGWPPIATFYTLP